MIFIHQMRTISYSATTCNQAVPPPDAALTLILLRQCCMCAAAPCGSTYSQTGYTTNCAAGTAPGTTCGSLACASGYSGTPSGTVTCAAGTYSGSLTGCHGESWALQRVTLRLAAMVSSGQYSGSLSGCHGESWAVQRVTLWLPW